MQTKTFAAALLAGTASLALAFGAQAAGKPASSGTSAAQSASNDTDAKIQALESEIQDLSNQVQDLKRSTADQYIDTQKQQAAAVKVTVANGRPTFSSADGKFTASIRALGQFDWGYFSQPGAAAGFPAAYGPDLSSGANFRRGYLGVQGKVFGDWSYNINYDFGGSGGTEDQGRIQSLYVEYDGLAPFAVRIGAYPAPANLEDGVGAADTIFLERNAVADSARNIAAGDGRDAVSLLYTGDEFFASLSYTGGKIKDGLGTFDEQNAVVARLSDIVYSDGDLKLLLSASGTDVFKPADNAAGPGSKENVSISAVPELTIDSSGYFTQSSATSVPTTTSGAKLINTGNIDAAHVYQWAAESAVNFQSLYAQGGYYWYSVDRRTGSLPNPDFNGWYAQAAWVLTGESRAYNPSTGAFGSPKPSAPFALDGSGIGAWELAARYSDLDLNYNQGVVGSATPASGVRGGEQKIWTVGVNWYPNSVIKFALDYEHIDISRIIGDATATTPFTVYPQITAAQADQSANQSISAVAIRAQISL
jgi:phosphate-selective porin OprO/OprP